MLRTYRWVRIGSLLLLMIGAGCERSPEGKKARHLERGDQYFTQQQYREASIEYRNALRIDKENQHAIQRLGFTFYQLGELGNSYPFLLRTKELDPKNIETRLKLGTMYLAGRKLAEAREEAGFVLEQDPKNFEALLLWVGSAETPEDIKAAITRLTNEQVSFGDRAKFHMALGALHLRNRDADKAERAFKEAVTKEPNSIEAHTLLGNFYLAKRDSAKAEQEFKAAAAIAPAGSPARITLADLYLVLNRPDEAKQVLDEITKEAPDFLPAWRRTAQIALGERRYDDSLNAIYTIMAKNPEDLDAHQLRGQVLLAKGETKEAMAELEHVVRSERQSAPAHYYLARAHIQLGNVQQAKNYLQEAKTIAPNYTDARLLLAELNIRSGAIDPAIEDLENLVQTQPLVSRAYVMLGTAYLTKKEPEKATETYRQFTQKAPKNPQGHYLVGVGLRGQKKIPEARKAFEEALALSPGFVEPLSQLITLDVIEKKSDVALARIQKQIALVPESERLQYLLGRIYWERGEGAAAEAAYLKAAAMNPQYFDPYMSLAGLYARTNRSDEALDKMTKAIEVNPKNVAAYMLQGMIQEQSGKILEAQTSYEKALELNPRFGAAANNLAYLYSEHGGDKEKALALAQTAVEVLPEDPRIADTLAWILYKRGVYDRALSLLRESAEKLSNNAEVQYHLGMTHYKLNNHSEAKEALGKALKLSSAFPGAEEAQRTLAELQ